MNGHLLAVLIRKDITLYFRNRYFALISVLGVSIYILIYTLMPRTVDETLSLAIYAPTIPDVFIEFLGGNDIHIAKLESDEALQQAIINSEYVAGIVLTADVVAGVLRGDETSITVYFASDAPTEMVNAIQTVLRLAFNQWSYSVNGNALRLQLNEQIVGVDMTGEQITTRNRLLPLMAVMLLVLEIMGLGSLIVEETTAGTLRALLITPVSLPILFIAKGIVGILLAFVPAALLITLTGNMTHEPLLILTTLLIGALLATGIAFLVASASDGMMTILAWGLTIIIIMVIPSYGVIFPGTATAWAKFIPSYYLFDTIHRVVNFGASWGAVMTNLVILLVAGVGFMTAGVMVMERKIR